MSDKLLAAYAATLLRVSMGVLFIAHGAVLKLMTYGLDGTTAYFVSIGYPAATAYLVIAAEVIGGALLILGVQVRVVAIGLVPLMIGATIQHIPNGWMFGNPAGGFEFPAFWTICLLIQALLGNGALALANLAEDERDDVASSLAIQS